MKKLFTVLFFTLYCISAWSQENFNRGKQLYENSRYKEALSLLQSAAKEGYGEACYMLGKMYYSGKGTEKNLTIAIRMYERGIEFGYDKGYIELGDIYCFGEGCKEDPKKAFEYYAKATNTEEKKKARSRIAMCWYYGLGVENTNLMAAYVNCKDILNSGDFNMFSKKEDGFLANLNILCMLSDFYMNEDYTTVNYYRKTVNKDLERACLCLYTTGVGFHMYRAAQIMAKEDITFWANNTRRSVYWVIRDAIRAGLPDSDKAQALYLYAMQIEKETKGGTILPGHDAELKNNWGWDRVSALTTSAQLGYAPAQKLLGDWYETGHFVSKNLVLAKQWHDKAAAQ